MGAQPHPRLSLFLHVGSLTCGGALLVIDAALRQDSYRHLQQSGLEAIPLWVFTVRHTLPNPNAAADDATVEVIKPYVVSGSSNVATFAKVLDTVRADAQAAAEMRLRVAKL